MGFDKTKVMRAAEKYLAQGKIPAAIKEYQLIVSHDPDDFTALNMLGDLLVRTQQPDEAIKCFTNVAEHYRDEGFALKAIAMYKKIDRLRPGSTDIAARLAPLYEMQGLVVDARTQYLIVADSYSRGGHAAQALEVLRKIADLDPHNTDIRIKLAEGYLRENFTSDAAEAFSHAGGQLFARHAYEEALSAYNRAIEIVAHDHAALSGLTSTHIALGSADEAAEVLEKAITKQPDDTELLSLLAQAHIASEEPEAAERATALLVAREPSSYKRYLDVVKLYLSKDNAGSATRVLNGIAEQMLSGNEDRTLAELLDEIITHDPERVEALRLLVRVHTWQHEHEKLRAVLERLADVAQTNGLVEDERHALTLLARFAPEEPSYLERLRELGGYDEDLASVESEGAVVFDEEVPTFESFVSMTETAEESSAPAGNEFEWNTVPQPSDDPSASFAELNESWTESSASTEKDEPHAFQEYGFGGAAKGTLGDEAGADSNGSEVKPERREEMIRQELESVDFYLAQGYRDIALDTLDLLERQFGRHPEIDSRRNHARKSPHVAGPAGDSKPEPFRELEFQASGAPATVGSEQTNVTGKMHVKPADAKPILDAGLAAIFDEFRIAVEEDGAQPTDTDYETHYNLGIAYKEMDLLDEAVEEFQTAVALVAPRDGTPRYLQTCNLLGHCFIEKKMPRLAVMWFRKGLGAPGHTEDEYQALRFELGRAFEQMGDLDNAIDVFTEVYGVDVSYRGVADKLRDLESQRASG